MYDFIHDISIRPAPFSMYTAKELWTKPHLAKQMLGYHLNQETDLASRGFEIIDNVVGWINEQLNLSGKRLCDLGCGPGLYTQRFFSQGAEVVGIDFSKYPWIMPGLSRMVIFTISKLIILPISCLLVSISSH